MPRPTQGINNSIETASLLVVSQDSAVLSVLWSIREANRWNLESVSNPWEAMERMQYGITPDMLLLDMPEGDADSLHILRWLRRLRPAMPIVVIGHPADVSRKPETIRMGAREYLTRPIEPSNLESAIQQHLSRPDVVFETDISSEDIEPVGAVSFFVGISPVMRRLRAQAALLAEANVPVLILGESGSGKETAARLLHKLSLRSGFEFSKVKCSALPSDLLEKELFGYQRNSGSGSPRTKEGKLEIAAKSTILLDEIAEMTMDLQDNLLEVLQNNRFIRPKTPTYVDVDVRILASSSGNLERAIAENRLREELYYRLSAYTLHVPPLRDRQEELPLLLRHFMHQLARQYGLSPREFSPAVIEACQTYGWPGNLRELENFVKRYLMVGDRKLVFEEKRIIPIGTGGATPLTQKPRQNLLALTLVQPHGIAEDANSLKSLVNSVKLEAEKNAINAALEKTGWNRKAAARLLKVSYRTLLYKIEQYQMTSSRSAEFPAGSGLRSRRPAFRIDSQAE
jgi:DNA-binding NtrC family response regulator